MASHTRRLLCAGIALSFASAASLAQGSSEEASKFPSKPITMLVGFAAGGSVDLTARQIGQQVCVDAPTALDVRVEHVEALLRGTVVKKSDECAQKSLFKK